MPAKAHLLGHPVSHSLSPRMQNAAFASVGFEAVYTALDVLPEALGATLEDLEADPSVVGCNVTVPHKVAVHDWLVARGRVLLPAGRVFGAVNTLVRGPDGNWQGDSTDYEGFLHNLRRALLGRIGADGRILSLQEVGGLKTRASLSPEFDAEFAACVAAHDVAILGAGGSAQTLARGFLTDTRFTPRSVSLFCRTPAKADGIVPPGNVHALTDFVAWNRGRRSLVVQTTTVGMDSGEGAGLSPVPEDALEAGQIACDIVYKPLETPFLREARARGAFAVQGLGMLVGQGAGACRKWLPEERRPESIFPLMQTMTDALTGPSA